MTGLFIYMGFVAAVAIVTACHIRIRDMEEEDGSDDRKM